MTTTKGAPHAARTALTTECCGTATPAFIITQLALAHGVCLSRHPARCNRQGSAHVQQVSVLFVAALVRRDCGQVEPRRRWPRPDTLGAPRASARRKRARGEGGVEAGEHAREKERRGGRGTRAIERERRTHTHTVSTSRCPMPANTLATATEGEHSLLRDGLQVTCVCAHAEMHERMYAASAACSWDDVCRRQEAARPPRTPHGRCASECRVKSSSRRCNQMGLRGLTARTNTCAHTRARTQRV